MGEDKWKLEANCFERNSLFFRLTSSNNWKLSHIRACPIGWSLRRYFYCTNWCGTRVFVGSSSKNRTLCTVNILRI